MSPENKDVSDDVSLELNSEKLQGEIFIGECLNVKRKPVEFDDGGARDYLELEMDFGFDEPWDISIGPFPDDGVVKKNSLIGAFTEELRDNCGIVSCNISDLKGKFIKFERAPLDIPGKPKKDRFWHPLDISDEPIK